jgi:protein-L-isoaspartate(D-aspartate) O-methyltransferase
MTDFAVLRQRMVDNQIRTSDVTDHEVIRAFLEVPREVFVAPSEVPFAYAGREVRMADAAPARRMLEPVQVARLVNALPHEADAKAMVVACGTGYSAAILSRLFSRVVALEQDHGLAKAARECLRQVGATNVAVVEGKLAEGWAGEAPYDAILVDGAVELVPNALVEQLKPEGVLAAIERDERTSRAMLYERVGAEAARWPQFDAWATLLPGFERRREFVF